MRVKSRTEKSKCDQMCLRRATLHVAKKRKRSIEIKIVAHFVHSFVIFYELRCQQRQKCNNNMRIEQQDSAYRWAPLFSSVTDGTMGEPQFFRWPNGLVVWVCAPIGGTLLYSPWIRTDLIWCTATFHCTWPNRYARTSRIQQMNFGWCTRLWRSRRTGGTVSS